MNLFTLNGKPGSLVESFTPDVSLYGTWTYDLFSAGQGVRDQKIHFNLNASLRGGWQAGASLLLEKFGYDPRIYGGYALEVPGAGGVGLDTVAFTGTPKIPNRDWVVTLTTPEFGRFLGQRIHHLGSGRELLRMGFGQSSSLRISGSTGARPISFASRPATSRTSTSGGPIARWWVAQRIPRLKVEYQLARPLFIRLVGEYNAYQQDSLRDDTRTDAPILIYDRRLGDYARAGRLHRQHLSGRRPALVYPDARYGALCRLCQHPAGPESFEFRGFPARAMGSSLRRRISSGWVAELGKR